MKAIILEVRDGYAAALREDGLVVKTKQLGEVGTTIELNEKVVAFPVRGKRIARTAVAAALALAVTGSAYTYTSVAEASYVTLDTEETSVELAVNRMGRVVKVRAMDDNSFELAQTLSDDVRRMKVEDAVDAAMTRMGGVSTVVAGVTGETEKRTTDLQEAVERGAERRERGDMELVTLEISRDERREAGEREMSAGRWAFERGGGRWRDEDADEPQVNSESKANNEPEAREESEARGMDERSAFLPDGESFMPPMGDETMPTPPENQGQARNMERDEAGRAELNDREPAENENDPDDERDGDDRPEMPESETLPPQGEMRQPQSDMPQEEMPLPQNSGSPIGEPPQGNGHPGFAPNGMQPPNGEMGGDPNGMPGGGAPQRQ